LQHFTACKFYCLACVAGWLQFFWHGLLHTAEWGPMLQQKIFSNPKQHCSQVPERSGKTSEAYRFCKGTAVHLSISPSSPLLSSYVVIILILDLVKSSSSLHHLGECPACQSTAVFLISALHEMVICAELNVCMQAWYRVAACLCVYRSRSGWIAKLPLCAGR
jgi:hypothetical protein